MLAPIRPTPTMPIRNSACAIRNPPGKHGTVTGVAVYHSSFRPRYHGIGCEARGRSDNDEGV